MQADCLDATYRALGDPSRARCCGAWRARALGRRRIRTLHFFHMYHTSFDRGWAKAELPEGGMRAAHPHSRPPSIDYVPFPTVFVTPFHYRHPITGDQPDDR